jgi:hypothetical protein
LCEDAVYQSILEIFAGVKKGVGQGPVGSTNRGEIKQLVEVDFCFLVSFSVHSWIRDRVR